MEKLLQVITNWQETSYIQSVMISSCLFILVSPRFGYTRKGFNYGIMLYVVNATFLVDDKDDSDHGFMT